MARFAMPRAPALETTPYDLPAGAVWVAYSGGLDSTVLLHVLAMRLRDAGRTVRALHVHHGLSPHADAWATHCQSTCDALGVALHVERVQVDTHGGLGVEAAARNARRAACMRVLGAGEVMTLAHHRDDQAETFLLRALRGSGPDGLAAMRAWTPMGEGHAWRPWLDVPRDAITAYADAHALRWIEDDSNADDRFDRNYLRRHVVPLLTARWPHGPEGLAQSASHSAHAVGLLDAEDAAELALARTPDHASLHMHALRTLAPARRARVVRRWIGELGLPPLPRRGVQAFDAMLGARADALPAFDWHGVRAQAWGGMLHAAPIVPPLAPAWRATWDGVAPLALPGGGMLSLLGVAALDRLPATAAVPGASPGFDAPVEVRARVGGERITLPGRTHSHALKHVLQDLGVPPWVRGRLPLLVASNGRVLAAADLALDARFAAWLRERGMRLEWARE